MTDEQAAQVKALTEFAGYKTSPGSRVLLLSILNWFDTAEKDPERWPGLETLLATALAARERAGWEEIIKKYSSTYDTFIEKEKLLIWCRQQQARAVKP